MTFYNVVSGLLFLGAVQQMALGLEAWNPSHIVMSCLLAALVFNDAVYTSHVVEGERTADYRLPLMLNDLFNFLLLALAIAALNPAKNAFEANLSNIFRIVPGARVQWFAETWYWSVLGVYWLSVMHWTYRAGQYSVDTHLKQLGLDVSGAQRIPYPMKLVVASLITALLFFVAALLACLESDMGGGLRRAVPLVYFLAFVVWLRPRWLADWDKHQRAAIKAA